MDDIGIRLQAIDLAVLFLFGVGITRRSGEGANFTLIAYQKCVRSSSPKYQHLNIEKRIKNVKKKPKHINLEVF